MSKKSLHYLFIGVLFSMTPNNLYCQSEIDSIQKVLPSLGIEDRVEALLQLGIRYYGDKNWELAQDAWERGLVNVGDNVILRGQFLNNLSAVVNKQKQLASSIDFAAQAVALYEREGLDSLLPAAYYNLGLAYKRASVIDSATIYIAKSIDYFQQFDSPDNLTRAINVYGNLLRGLNRYSEAKEYLERALAYYSNSRDSTGQALVWNNLGNVYRAEKSYDLARQAYLQSMALKLPYQDSVSIGLTYYNLALVSYYEQEFQQSLESARKALLFQKNQLDQAFTWLSIAESSIAMGQLPEGQEALERIVRLVDIKSVPELYLDWLILQKYYSQRTGNTPSALAYLETYIEVLEEQNRVQKEATAETYAQLFRISDLENIRSHNEARIQSQSIQLSQGKTIQLILTLLALSLIAALFFAIRSFKVEKKAKNRISTLLRELHHRLANNLDAISGIMALEIANVNDPIARESLTATHDRINAINLVHNNLYKGEANRLADVQLSAYFRTLTDNVILLSGVQVGTLEFNLEEVAMDVDHAIPLGLIINEVITNATKYGLNSEGKLSLTLNLKQNEELVQVQVQDGGSGISQIGETKDSVGYTLIQSLANQVKAKYSAKSTDSGFVFKLEMKSR